MRFLRKSLLALASVFTISAALGQTPPSKAATAPPATAPQRPAPSTTTPSDANERAHPAWYQACLDRVAAANAATEADPAQHIDLLFVGDSITEGWTSAGWGGENRGLAVWNKVYVPRHALNFGVGADTTQDVLHRFDTMDVQHLTPKVVVLLIGTNNTRNSAPEIADGVHAILGKVESLYPAARIILVSILPNARATQLMADANALIRPYADEKTVFYLDLTAVMTAVPASISTDDKPAPANWLGLGKDRLHPNQSGYQLWADTMEPLLDRLLALPPSP